MDTIRWGIVGAGRIAHTFAQDLPATRHGVLRAVAARDGAAARAFADRYGAPAAYAGYQGLYADPDVDAVYVATPHTLHATNARDALHAGKAVLCEKPITTSAAECRALIDVAGETGGYLMEAMWTWFLPAVRTAKAWVEAGRIGRIVQIRADFGYRLDYSPNKREYDAQLGGGCLLEMGVYPVAIAALFSGQDPESVSVVSRHAPNGVEDDVAATFAYPDFVATLATSFRARLPNAAYVVGEDAWIAIPDFFRARECQLWVVDDQVEHFDDGRTTHGFNYQVDAMDEDLIAGRSESRIVTLADSLRFQEHMDRVRSRLSGGFSTGTCTKASD